MSQLATIPPSDYFTPGQLDLIKTQICPGSSDGELQLFIAICQRTGLDPFSRQIYAVMRETQGRKKMVIQTGIDGYRAIADRQSDYAGSDAALYDEGVTLCQHIKAGKGANGEWTAEPPMVASVTIYKMVAGQRCAFTGEAAWASYYPGDGPVGKMWRKFPHLMLAKCAEAAALRKGWAAHMHGVYTTEEMQQADTITVQAVPADDLGCDAEYSTPEERREQREAAKSAAPRQTTEVPPAAKAVAQQRLAKVKAEATAAKGESFTCLGKGQIPTEGKDRVEFMARLDSNGKDVLITYYNPEQMGQRIKEAGYTGPEIVSPHLFTGRATADLAATKLDNGWLLVASSLRIAPLDELAAPVTVEEIKEELASAK